MTKPLFVTQCARAHHPKALTTAHPAMSLANLFNRPHYTSEATDFLEQLKRDRPGIEQGQRDGRARLWDKQIDRELQAEFQAGRVAQQGYVYYHYSLDPNRK